MHPDNIIQLNTVFLKTGFDFYLGNEIGILSSKRQQLIISIQISSKVNVVVKIELICSVNLGNVTIQSDCMMPLQLTSL